MVESHLGGYPAIFSHLAMHVRGLNSQWWKQKMSSECQEVKTEYKELSITV